jgi:hypothetical protein
MADWWETVEEIQADIAELRAALDAGPGLPRETRVTGLAALVNAKALVFAVERFELSREGIAEDVIGPLASALSQFPEAANRLAAGLRRLPDR